MKIRKKKKEKSGTMTGSNGCKKSVRTQYKKQNETPNAV